MGRRFDFNLFGYMDYRSFLKDWYTESKKTRASISLRAFSKRAGFASPNFFKLVMDGDRNLTEESLTKFIVGLGLNKQEQDFFRNLVFFNQASSHDQKNYYYQKLLQSRKFSELKPIEKNQYEFYREWYHPVIRELAVSKNFTGPEWIVERLGGKVSLVQVNRSLALLEELGFLEKTKKGLYKQADPLISTGPESAEIILLNYHQNLLALVKENLPKVEQARRDISALTLGVKKERLPELKKRIADFRKEILKMVSTDTEPEEVVILSMQLLPVA